MSSRKDERTMKGKHRVYQGEMERKRRRQDDGE